MFSLGVERLPSFKILQSFKQWTHTQVPNRITVFPESFSTSLNQLTLTGFIRFNGSQVANDFIQPFGGFKEAMKGHNGREARCVQVHQTSEEVVPIVAVACFKPNRFAPAQRRFPRKDIS